MNAEPNTSHLCFFPVYICRNIAVPACVYAAPSAQGRERLLMDGGWKFHLGDPAGEATQKRRLRSCNGGTSRLRGARKAGKRPPPLISRWMRIGKTQAFRRTCSTGGGASRGIAPRFPILPGVTRVLHFEGVDDNATVYVNGKKLLHHEGYDDPFNVPLKDVWKEGGPNIVAVLVENTAGAGSIGAVGFQESESAVDDAFARPSFSDSGLAQRPPAA